MYKNIYNAMRSKCVGCIVTIDDYYNYNQRLTQTLDISIIYLYT